MTKRQNPTLSSVQGSTIPFTLAIKARRNSEEVLELRLTALKSQSSKFELSRELMPASENAVPASPTPFATKIRSDMHILWHFTPTRRRIAPCCLPHIWAI